MFPTSDEITFPLRKPPAHFLNPKNLGGKMEFLETPFSSPFL